MHKPWGLHPAGVNKMQCMEQRKMNRIAWVDTVRGICMIAILLFHTEIYYTGGTVISYNLYVCNALMVFFFVSGYLFYRDAGFSLRMKLMSILRSLILPYFLFTVSIALVKSLLHIGTDSLPAQLDYIVYGGASWFVSALVVSELAFSLLLSVSNRYCRYILPAGCTLMFVLSAFLNTHVIVFWNYNVSAMSMLFLYLGYVFHRKEAAVRRAGSLRLTLLSAVTLVGIKHVELSHGMQMIVCPLSISNYPIFFIDSILGICVLVNVSRWLPSVRLLSFTGSHSIVYYFMSGAVPMLTSTILRKFHFCYEGGYERIIIAGVLVYMISTFVTWIVYKYLPWMTNFKFPGR